MAGLIMSEFGPEAEPVSSDGRDRRAPDAAAQADLPHGESFTVVPLRHPAQWITAAIVLLFAAAIIKTAVVNPNFEWPVVWQYLFADIILKGLGLSLALTVLAMLLGAALGTLIAVMRISHNPFLNLPAHFYLWFFRGTPVLVQLIFWYNLAALFPVISIGIPFGPSLFEASANDLITPFTAALLGLSLNEGAYMAEIVRGGILAVDEGQLDAARALGMRHSKVLRRIVLPQAMKVIVPPTGNETIGMLKMTSLVSVIALSDLLYSAQTIYSRTFQTIPLLLVACFWYLVVTSIMSLVQAQIEKKFSSGRREPARRSLLLALWRRR